MATTRASNKHDPSIITHPLDPQDAAVTAAMREMLRPAKGARQGIEGRAPFDAFMGSVLPRDDVSFQEDTMGGVSGLWVHPANALSDSAILHLHGGWFNFGSAQGYRHLVSHIAARAKTSAFVPDYRRAPEHRFPAATVDALACYRAFAARGISLAAITGDSAGGNLALGLASRLTIEPASNDATLAAVAVLSPVTDLTLSGSTYQTRADADPLFTRAQIADLVHSYLDNADAHDALASPLFGRLSGLPAVRIDVGDDEVLLDDSLRYVERADVVGVDATVHIWMGMPHGFPASVGRLKAAAESLDAIGSFLTAKLHARGA